MIDPQIISGLIRNTPKNISAANAVQNTKAEVPQFMNLSFFIMNSFALNH